LAISPARAASAASGLPRNCEDVVPARLDVPSALRSPAWKKPVNGWELDGSGVALAPAESSVGTMAVAVAGSARSATVSPVAVR
jgi:hypothetical protein